MSWSSEDFSGITRRALLAGGACALCLAAVPARAQLDIEITGVGANLFPLAFPTMAGTAASPGDIAAVASSDLVRSGRFRIVGPKVELTAEQAAAPDMILYQGTGCSAAVVGSVTQAGAETWSVTASVVDPASGKSLGDFHRTTSTQDIRMTAHRLADWVHEVLAGIQGCFASRIAYVQRQGRRYELVIADSDGENARTALRSGEPIISPAWSPDGTKVAYVSFEGKRPVVYMHTLATGERSKLAEFPGNNSSPAFSPDGATMAVALSKDGGTHVYLMSAAGGEARRLTTDESISTEPAFSPDGEWVYFTSDRGGSPQIYRMRVSGGSAERVTFTVPYAVSPSLSPDGKRLVFVARTGAGLQIHSLDLATGDCSAVSRGGADEAPSFSPNGELILYASSSGGRGVLATAGATGGTASRLSGRTGSIREPVWGPLVK